jgi:hypothetical protein
MRQFMRKKGAALRCGRRILVRAEDDVLTTRICPRVDIVRHVCCTAIGVETNGAQIVSIARFEKCAGSRV